MTRARVLLADDHPSNAELLRSVLETEFDVVADVVDGCELVRAAEQYAPDVIVTDIGMPGMDGIAAARSILSRNPGARVVLVTMHNDPAIAREGMDTGALGFVLKLVADEELVPAVRAALRGERYVTQSSDPAPPQQDKRST